ncbi:collagen alpha-1(I) chain-like [Hippopotamus amphibius kiboko]|uniref:collagen alpha-1(I) chain-like n=1 Tax=Hippopotamus amphibius kiboko TaxID=575201 RepID=UPI002597C473|nr:collagen alpha-1(I) chain-like [Hippopotamus amphibius kiboko]
MSQATVGGRGSSAGRGRERGTAPRAGVSSPKEPGEDSVSCESRAAAAEQRPSATDKGPELELSDHKAAFAWGLGTLGTSEVGKPGRGRDALRPCKWELDPQGFFSRSPPGPGDPPPPSSLAPGGKAGPGGSRAGGGAPWAFPYHGHECRSPALTDSRETSLCKPGGGPHQTQGRSAGTFILEFWHPDGLLPLSVGLVPLLSRGFKSQFVAHRFSYSHFMTLVTHPPSEQRPSAPGARGGQGHGGGTGCPVPGLPWCRQSLSVKRSRPGHSRLQVPENSVQRIPVTPESGKGDTAAGIAAVRGTDSSYWVSDAPEAQAKPSSKPSDGDCFGASEGPGTPRPPVPAHGPGSRLWPPRLCATGRCGAAALGAHGSRLPLESPAQAAPHLESCTPGRRAPRGTCPLSLRRLGLKGVPAGALPPPPFSALCSASFHPHSSIFDPIFSKQWGGAVPVPTPAAAARASVLWARGRQGPWDSQLVSEAACGSGPPRAIRFQRALSVPRRVSFACKSGRSPSQLPKFTALGDRGLSCAIHVAARSAPTPGWGPPGSAVVSRGWSRALGAQPSGGPGSRAQQSPAQLLDVCDTAPAKLSPDLGHEGSAAQGLLVQHQDPRGEQAPTDRGLKRGLGRSPCSGAGTVDPRGAGPAQERARKAASGGRDPSRRSRRAEQGPPGPQALPASVCRPPHARRLLAQDRDAGPESPAPARPGHPPPSRGLRGRDREPGAAPGRGTVALTPAVCDPGQRLTFPDPRPPHPWNGEAHAHLKDRLWTKGDYSEAGPDSRQSVI